MASIFSHAVVAYAFNEIQPKHKYRARLILLSVAYSMLPDADVIGFAIGIPYEHQLGHRGASHSIFFSLCLAFVSTYIFFWKTEIKKIYIFLILFLSGASHGFLDAITNGGHGIGFFWPIDHGRYFLPYRPVEVSPIGVKAFFSSWGVRVMISEFVFIMCPALVCIIITRLVRAIKEPKTTSN